MEYHVSKPLIAKLAHQIKLLTLGMGALVVCNALLGGLLWHQSGHEDIVLIPAGLHQTMRITQGAVSNTYLESMAQMLVNDRLNITPDNVLGSNQNLLTFIDPAFYAAFKKQLSLDAKAIADQKISSSFYINTIRSNPKTLVVSIAGQLKRWVGERFIGQEIKQYQLHFSLHSNQLLLQSFQEIKPAQGDS
jgi:type IV conjugative transfer system protein TraE